MLYQTQWNTIICLFYQTLCGCNCRPTFNILQSFASDFLSSLEEHKNKYMSVTLIQHHQLPLSGCNWGLTYVWNYAPLVVPPPFFIKYFFQKLEDIGGIARATVLTVSFPVYLLPLFLSNDSVLINLFYVHLDFISNNEIFDMQMYHRQLCLFETYFKFICYMFPSLCIVITVLSQCS